MPTSVLPGFIQANLRKLHADLERFSHRPKLEYYECGLTCSDARSRFYLLSFDALPSFFRVLRRRYVEEVRLPPASDQELIYLLDQVTAKATGRPLPMPIFDYFVLQEPRNDEHEKFSPINIKLENLLWIERAERLEGVAEKISSLLWQELLDAKFSRGDLVFSLQFSHSRIASKFVKMLRPGELVRVDGDVRLVVRSDFERFLELVAHSQVDRADADRKNSPYR